MVWKIRRAGTGRDPIPSNSRYASSTGFGGPTQSLSISSPRELSSSSPQIASSLVIRKTCVKKDYDLGGSGEGSQSSQGSPVKKCDGWVEDHVTLPGDKSAGTRSQESRSQVSSTNGSKKAPSVDRRSAKSATSKKSILKRSVESPRTQRKRVSFGVVLIRRYERIVGDNPSCSSGPPIGIGWAHTETEIIKLHHFESMKLLRSHRRRMVLSREEREELLLHWGASLHEIINSIRMYLRIKNQRRQSVLNYGKVEKIEEAFENATRKLKKAIGLRRSTEKKVKALQQQANLARKSEPVKTPERNVSSETQSKTDPHQAQPEIDELENFEFELPVPDFDESHPLESAPLSVSSDLSRKEDDFTFSGTTIGGNSTTASVLEMEKFYRELELEMFGDELPSMVGHTLEVPSDKIPEENRLYDNPVSPLPSVPESTGHHGESKDVDDMPTDSAFITHSEVKVYLKSASARRLANEHFEFLGGNTGIEPVLLREQQMPHGHPPSNHVPHFHHFPPEMGYVQTVNSSTKFIDTNHHLLSPLPISESPHATCPQRIMPYAMEIPYHDHGAIPYWHAQPSNPRPRKSSSRKSSSKRSRNSPVIRHNPPPTHISPTQWMEDCSTTRHECPIFDPIIISEEVCDFGWDFLPSNTLPGPGCSHHPPTVFAPSFY